MCEGRPVTGHGIDLHHLQLTETVKAPPIRGPATAPSIATSFYEQTRYVKVKSGVRIKTYYPYKHRSMLLHISSKLQQKLDIRNSRGLSSNGMDSDIIVSAPFLNPDPPSPAIVRPAISIFDD